MISMQLQGFRCFRDSGAINIKPITILVGENSSGKSSFLAALRYVSLSTSMYGGSSFNSDPFFLGGYDEIANFRGGRGGRSKEFSICIEEIAPPGFIENEKSTERRVVRQTLSFKKGHGQPDLARFMFQTVMGHILVDVTGENPVVEVSASGGKRERFHVLNGPPSELVRQSPTFTRYVIDELRFGKQDLKEVDSVFNSIYDVVRKTQRARGQDSVIAMAPMRSQPKRVYISSDPVSPSEGSDVPLELARLSVADPDQWEIVKERLELFGRSAGLFNSLDIRRLGRSAGDPFQILIKTSRQYANIMDVGYGVSQSLPVVYSLLFNGYDMFMLQQPEVHLHPRAQAEIGSLISSLSLSRPEATYLVETHSDYLLDRLRIAVMNGSLPHENVGILYFEKTEVGSRIFQIGLDKSGGLVGQPDSYRGFFLQEQASILGI